MKTRNKVWKAPMAVFMVFLVFIFVLFIQYLYLSISPNIYGINMDDFASLRNTYSGTIYAKRGTIYDNENNVLATDVNSYTLIAYLDESRTGSSSVLYHVEDKEATAEALAPILGMDEDDILSYLELDKYQTYLGIKGKNLSELTKQKIELLNLPGIEFEENYQRYYPNGDFASYVIGYAKTKNYLRVTINNEYDLSKILSSLIGSYPNITWKVYSNDYFDMSFGGVINTKQLGMTTVEILSNGNLVDTCVIEVTEDYTTATLEEKIMGELGIETKYEEILKGINGYIEYQQDRYGIKIPDAEEKVTPAVEGSNVYLTVDSTIQRILENAVDAAEEYKPEWMTISVMDAKTGDILGSASTPSYDPNVLNITNYENPLTSFVYEPGSVMKIFTYMCAIEKGTYKGEQTYKSGSITYDKTTIYDWNTVGWGEITYDYGFEMSSNVAVSYMVEDFITKDELRDCLLSYGFGEKTGIDLSRELTGNVKTKDLTSPVDVASAAFGQGISTTPIQQLQALSIIANDGYMVKPHVVSKIENNDEVTYTREISKNQVVSKETTDKIRQLMYNTVHDVEGQATGRWYLVEGLDVIGKTGTAEIYNEEAGKYLGEYIYSFSGMFPKDDPEIIVFVSMKKPTSSTAIRGITKEVIESIANYKGMLGNSNIESPSKYDLLNFTNLYTEDVVTKLENDGLKVKVLGEGNKIISQYPYADTTILNNEEIVLITNDKEIEIPSLVGYSRIKATTVLNLLGIDYEIEGYGFVKEQNVEDDIVKIVLEEKHIIDE